MRTSDRVRTSVNAGFSWRWLGLALGPAAFLALAFVPSPLHELPGYGHRPAFAAGVAALMAIWWFTEAVPIGWTACVPLLLYPALGVFGQGFVGDTRRVLDGFLDAYIFMFLGGMVIGAAMEQWGLHRRIALHIMRAVGTAPRRLLLGMLLATAAVSLWISNTATAVMMVPISVALIRELEHGEGRPLPRFGGVLMLAVAYAANVGGIGTKIGSGTNSIFVGYVSEKLGRDLSFIEYMAAAFPFVVLFLPLIWLVLWREGQSDAPKSERGRSVLDEQLRLLGAMSTAERRVAFVFGAAAALWVLGDPIRALIAPHVPKPWEGFRFQGKHYEAAVALLAAAVLAVTRSVSWASLVRVPWTALLLLGGSFAMALGIEGSGLSGYLAEQVEPLAKLSPLAQLFLATGATVLLSAVASNTATVNLMLNLLPQSVPLLSTIAFASSCDFALPAGTPPNAIVFGSGYVRLPTMMRVGVVLDVLAVLALTAYGFLYVSRVIG